MYSKTTHHEQVNCILLCTGGSIFENKVMYLTVSKAKAENSHLQLINSRILFAKLSTNRDKNSQKNMNKREIPQLDRKHICVYVCMYILHIHI